MYVNKVRASVAAFGLGLFAVCMAAVPVLADPPHGERREARAEVLDSRYGHNRYYPARGHVVDALPRGYAVAHYRRAPYYFHGGIWYRPSGPRFVVVTPPVGLFVDMLPPFYTTVWVRGAPYYYADDVYYVWRGGRRGYQVVAPPREAEVETRPAVASVNNIYIYPKNGQTEEQQAKDRYECHSWGAQQTGFDPTQPLGGVPESQAVAKRADYMRAMTACLEARGYSVK